MGIEIIRDRKEKPLFKGIEILKKYKLEELTCNNILICDTYALAEKIRNELLTLKDKNNDISVGLYNEELYKLSDDDWNKYLYDNENTLDNLIIQWRADKVTIQAHDYAIQNFYITTTAEIVYKSIDTYDLWFISEEDYCAFSDFKGHREKFKNKRQLIADIRIGRYLDWIGKIV